MTCFWHRRNHIFNVLKLSHCSAGLFKSCVRVRTISNIFRLLAPSSLKLLTLQNFEFTENWLQLFPNDLPNITELRFYDVQLTENIDELERFLIQLPRLEVFIHTGDGQLEIESVAELLLKHFPNLRGFGYAEKYIETECVPNRCGFDLDFGGFKFIENFHNIQELHLGGRGYERVPCRNLHSILRFVPNIKVLAIWELNLMRVRQPPVEIRKLVKSIKEIVEDRRERFPTDDDDRVHILLTNYLHNEFEVIPNVHNWIRFTVKNK